LRGSNLVGIGLHPPSRLQGLPPLGPPPPAKSPGGRPFGVMSENTFTHPSGISERRATTWRSIEFMRNRSTAGAGSLPALRVASGCSWKVESGGNSILKANGSPAAPSKKLERIPAIRSSHRSQREESRPPASRIEGTGKGGLTGGGETRVAAPAGRAFWPKRRP